MERFEEKRIVEIIEDLRASAKINNYYTKSSGDVFDDAASMIESLQAQLADKIALLDAAITGQETLQKALDESQQRERAAVEELYDAAPCFACVNFNRNSGKCFGAGRCRYAEPEYSRYPNGFEWRGLQQAGKKGGAE